MGMVKESINTVIIFLVMVKINTLCQAFSGPGMAIEPMTVMAIGMAVAGGVQSIFGGKASAAAIRAQNKQAHRNWIQSNTNKVFANSREQFQSAYLFAQQLKRNDAIGDAAYLGQAEATEYTKDMMSNTSKDMARSLQGNAASLQQAISLRGISSQSGSYGALATAQALDALAQAGRLKQGFNQELKNINTQFKSSMSQQTNNIFMPNIQGYDESPLFGNAGAAETAGWISGGLQIGTAIGTAFTPTKSSTSTTSTTTPASTSSSGSAAPWLLASQ